MIFKLFVINQLQILFFFKSLFSVTFWCHFWRYHRFWWNFLMNTKNEDFFSKLSKFFDIFLVSVFNWELFWFSSNSLKKYANLAKFSLKRSDLIDFWRQNDNSGNDVLSWLQTQKKSCLDLYLDFGLYVCQFGPIALGLHIRTYTYWLDLWTSTHRPGPLDVPFWTWIFGPI